MLLHKSCISIPYQFLLLKVVLNTITLTQYLFPYVPKIFFYLSLCWVVVVIEMFFLLIEKSVWSWYSFKYLCTGTYPYFQSKHDNSIENNTIWMICQYAKVYFHKIVHHRINSISRIKYNKGKFTLLSLCIQQNKSLIWHLTKHWSFKLSHIILYLVETIKKKSCL
jgi:hypothetical protein